MTNRILIGGLVAFSLASPGARADWQSALHVKVQRPGSGPSEITGEMHAKKNKQRIDFKQGVGAGAMSTIIDLKEKKAWTILHEKKSILESDLNAVNSNIPACATDQVDACLAQQGFAKTGHESVGGHPCAIYAKTTTGPDGKKSTVTVWRPEDVKEVPAMKTTATNDRGEVAVETLVTDLKIKPQPDALFKLPKGYSTMSIMDMMKKFQERSGGK